MAATSVTVITINRNMGEQARRTAVSVREQTHPCSWVVIDGASCDASKDILQQSQRPGDGFLSEPDGGIAEAFNKGIGLAPGQGLVFLNSGDTFSDPQALERLAQAWRSGSPWVTGGAEVLDEKGRFLYRRCHEQATGIQSLLRRGCRIWHAATLVERSLFERHGRFDTSYRIAMDYELWLRLAAAGLAPRILLTPICQFRLGGISSRIGARLREDRRARLAHGFVNPRLTELRLAAIARVKQALAPISGPTLYRLKERFRL